MSSEELKVKIDMECSPVNLLDLSDEILMIIFKKLEKFEILYSLMDINMRLNQIVCDPSIITTQITFMKQASLLKLTSPLPEIVLDRLCSQILPKIHDRIKWLKLETSSMERILLAANNYSNLRQLDIFIMDIEKADMHLFTSKMCDFDYFSHLVTDRY
jgi:hypothetical protein